MTKRHHALSHSTLKNSLFLSVIDGLEGGFAIFAGIVVGLSFTSADKNILIASALVGILVSAINAAVLRYSSEHYLDELDGHEKRSPFRHYFLPSVLEGSVYIAMSFVAVLPLLVIDNLAHGIIIMIVSCLVILFMAGALRGRYLAGRHWLRDGLEILGGGALIIGIGAIAGSLVARTFGA